ncbi:AAA family ATPase [Citrobacter youngae]|uniref:AAA family ATPase n=1 Tax=Citrobacter youngae TaxID=133448 RepID=UPI002B23D670|nr:AAA family ATPase [Citrobacter youngae]MEB1028548.1 AAA family ATPase [Citrobacter youngae]
MKFTISSTIPYKGLDLAEPFSFDGHLCLITGKNGSGKTRLLQSIKNDHTKISVEGEFLAKHQISAINVTNENQSVLSNNIDHRIITKLAESIFQLIVDANSIDAIPEAHPVYFTNDRISRNAPSFNAREIIKRALNLFDKEIQELGFDELEFSILLNKEIIDGKTDTSLSSLSLITLNYYQALRKKKYIDFLIHEGENIKKIDDCTFYKLLGPEDPSIVFSRIISKMFRGKFTLTTANKLKSHINYTPKLLLNKNGEPIDHENLSSGEKVIFWLAEKTFYMNYINTKNIHKGNSIILMDEPDSHLHPQMVQDFYDCLQALHQTLNIAFIFNTHSPTTVALSPIDNIFNITPVETSNYSSIKKINKDEAISQLLDGVSQISVNPDNNRQVYVENINDSFIYEKLFTQIRNRSKIINPAINLSFISAGPKLADNELAKHINSVFNDQTKTQSLIEKINGDANCQQVIGMVEYLKSGGNRTVRGLIDWDNTTRKHIGEVIVCAKDYAYSIENIVYDPISIYAFHASNSYKNPNHFFECDEDYHWKDCLDDKRILQMIVDNITHKILGRESKRDHIIKYMSGLSLIGDREYYIPTEGKNGHDFEKVILKHYPDINKLKTNNKGRPLIYHFTMTSTLGPLGPSFIATVIEEAFAALQK